MKSVLFKEKLLSALDFAKQNHEPCRCASVTLGILRYVFFVEPYKDKSLTSLDDDYHYRICLKTSVVVSPADVNSNVLMPERLIHIQCGYIPMTEASFVFDSLVSISSSVDYEVCNF